MEAGIKFNRRKFFRYLSTLTVIPGYLLWKSLSERRLLLHKTKNRIELTPGLPAGVTFKEDAIIISEADKVRVFSSRCTHLGCKINEYSDNRLTCPCHGSEYDLDGNVLEGPAVQPLKLLTEIDKPINEKVVIDA